MLLISLIHSNSGTFSISQLIEINEIFVIDILGKNIKFEAKTMGESTQIDLGDFKGVAIVKYGNESEMVIIE